MGGAGLQTVDHALDQAALAGSVPAVDADDDTPAGLVMVDLQVEQLVLKFAELPHILLVADRAILQLDLVERRPFAHAILRGGGSCQSRIGWAMHRN